MLSFLNQYVFGPALPVFLLLAGVFFAVRIGNILLRHPLQAGRGLLPKDPETGRYSTSSIKSTVTALAGTLGVGNITGVACAITAGGPGTVFWMWISAFAVMTVKYAEVVLACKFRRTDEDGQQFGGAPYYMRDGWNRPKIAFIFALLILVASFAVGNMTQTGAAAETAQAFFGFPRWVSGIFLTALLYVVIRGGKSRIIDFANLLIPALTVIYMIFSLIIIGKNASMLPQIFSLIMKDAFTPRAGISGIAGYLMMPSLRLGTARGIFSNEAGCGTAPTAHATSSALPSEQGLFGIFEVFVDTILLCTMTAFVILISYESLSAYDGTELAIRAFSTVLGKYVVWILAFSVMLYALASTVAWAYYGMEAVRYLTKNKTADGKYRLFYSMFCFLGAICPMRFIFEMSDFMISLMTIINVCCLLALSGVVKRETLAYFAKNRRC